MITAVSLQDRIAYAQNRKKRVFVYCLVFVLVAIITALSFSSVAVSVRSAEAQHQVDFSRTPIMQRLSQRLAVAENVDLSVAMEERKELLTHKLAVHFVASESGTKIPSLSLNLADHPSWIVFERGDDGAMHAVVSADRLEQDLAAMTSGILPEARSCDVLSTVKDAKGVLRAETSCIAHSGYDVDPAEFGSVVKSALETTQSGSVAVPVTTVTAVIHDADYAPYDTFTLLATGHSNFKGSGDGRKSNVRKALNERMHNVLVPAGETFSYNDALGNAGSLKDGWKMALTIFEGVNLRMAPGGGVCQVSTTIYRAALRAGFPIVEQKNHSIYVSYYEAYGVGQDATVYPGKQDFRFLNNTGHPILLQSYNEGDDAYVNIYGIDDGRTVTVKGPYFANNVAQEITAQDKKLRGNEIGWVRSVQSPTGEISDDVFIARYNAIPKTLSKRHTAKVEATRTGIWHAAAGSGELAVR